MPSQTAALIGALGADVYRAWCSTESFVSAQDVPGESFIGDGWRTTPSDVPVIGAARALVAA